MNIEFFSNIHNKEFATKDRLVQKSNNIITVMTTLAGLFGFVAINYKSTGNNNLDSLFWLVMIVTLICLVLAGYFLIISYRVPHLNEIDRPSKWAKFWQETKTRYDTDKDNQSFDTAKEEFEDYLIQLYCEVADDNIQSNYDRGIKLVNSHSSMLASFVFLVFSYLTYYVNNYLIEHNTPDEQSKSMFNEEKDFICVAINGTEFFEFTGRPGKRPVPGRGPEPDREKPPPPVNCD